MVGASYALAKACVPGDTGPALRTQAPSSQLWNFDDAL